MLRSSVSRLVISRRIWRNLTRELEQRSHPADGAPRESGAFLLAQRERHRITDIVFYDDLDPTSLNGAVHFRAAAYGRLWSECERLGAKVVGDVHTHPGTYVDQSPIDRANPMIDSVGHVALIVPNFARGSVAISSIGAFIYQGDGRWCRHEPSRILRRGLR